MGVEELSNLKSDKSSLMDLLLSQREAEKIQNTVDQQVKEVKELAGRGFML